MPNPQLAKVDSKESLKEWDRRIAITQTLKPILNGNSSKEQLLLSQDKFEDFLKQISTNYTYSVELTKQANIHYHGMCTIKPEIIGKCTTLNGIILKIENIKRHWNLVLGYTVIKRLADPDGWLQYITKDLQTTQEVLEIDKAIFKYIEQKTQELNFNTMNDGAKQNGEHRRPIFSLISPRGDKLDKISESSTKRIVITFE